MHVGDRSLWKVKSGGAEEERSMSGAKIDVAEIKDYQQPGPNCRHDPDPIYCPSPSTGNAETLNPAAMTKITSKIY